MVDLPGGMQDPKNGQDGGGAPLGAADGDEEGAKALDPREAYEVLEIRTPLEEFDAYARARAATLSHLGDAEKADLAMRALELGRRALMRVTGSAPIQDPRT